MTHESIPEEVSVLTRPSANGMAEQIAASGTIDLAQIEVLSGLVRRSANELAADVLGEAAEKARI